MQSAGMTRQRWMADGSGSDTAAGSQLAVRDLSDSRKDKGLWDDVISHHPTIV